MANHKSTIIKDTIILLIITLVAGFALAAVNRITTEPIAYARTEEKNKAYRAMFNDAETFEENEDLIKKCNSSKEFLVDKGFNGTKIDEALIAKSNNEVIGYILNSTSPNGYGGNIQISLGLDKEGKIQGFEILSISETVGLGMKANDDEFKSQFAGKNVKEIKYTKSGAAAEDEINAISGATITTAAVTEAVNSALVFAEEYIINKEAF
ncbi:RnfABCDGE type electron transport complex subunit G [Clostridium sp. AL.422]|uniref:RnfABCDGE type electron transport complex subunit G n=1 Tax=Clostridium TaxID=1485 RepID=UPI00293DA8BC|nr:MULTISPECIES: RnfABCDGE type electron transport complex subunit G [unclassified Clostridium]MDV4151146.1 RnfABCDGE type electron transport complex subunit G [Clostridium sp. AL.422]